MIDKITKKELTRDKIKAYLLKKPNIRKGRLGLEIKVHDERATFALDPYVHINDRENIDFPINPKLLIPKIEIHLTYFLNSINRRLIEKIFSKNDEIKLIYHSKTRGSIFASREIRTLNDVDEILDLAARYHEIVNSDNYDKTLKSHRNEIDNLANEVVDSLIEV